MSLSIQEKTRRIGFTSSNRSNPEHDFSNQPIYREKGREVTKDFENRIYLAGKSAGCPAFLPV